MPMTELSAQLEKAYKRRFGADLEYRNAVWRLLTRDFFHRYVRSSDHVLDLGCGYGQFINHVQAQRRYAMDLNPASKGFLDENVTLFAQDCSTRWPLESASLDVVFSSNFFEHLPTKDHLQATLEEACRCLRTGGRLIAMGPNVKYLPGAYWDFFDHHIPLTELALQEALELLGFRCREVIDRFLPFTMVKGPHYPLAFVSLYLKMPWLWRYFGKQFLVIGEKSR